MQWLKLVNRFKALLFVTGAIFSSLALAVDVPSSTTQGGLIMGKASPGETVYVNGVELRQTDEGRFVFGVGRDAKSEIVVTVQTENGKQTPLPIKVTQRQYDIQEIEGLPPKMVSPPKEVLARIRNDNSRVAVARRTDSSLLGFLKPFIWPAEGRISGIYGSQRILNGVPKRPHFGIDVAAPTGTPVIAPTDGVVTLAVDNMYYSGGTLIIDHGFGISSTFIHLDKIHVKVGDAIAQGQLIADIGATGRVTGAHLDWRINWFKERLDPELLVPARR